MDLEQWVRENGPKKEMFYYNPVLAQFKRFADLASDLGVEAQVAGYHTSKSIRLPVVQLRGTNGTFLLRDNFYDINLCALWDFAPNLPLDLFYPTHDWGWYLDAMRQKRDYSFRGWTDEEMDDPRILRVHFSRDCNGLPFSGYWKEVRGEEKDRWAARMTSTEWYSRDWSSGRLLVVGPMGPGCTFYLAYRAFAEGIGDVVSAAALEPYELGKRSFTVALPGEDMSYVLRLIRTINEAKPLGESHDRRGTAQPHG